MPGRSLVDPIFERFLSERSIDYPESFVRVVPDLDAEYFAVNKYSQSPFQLSDFARRCMCLARDWVIHDLRPFICARVLALEEVVSYLDWTKNPGGLWLNDYTTKYETLMSDEFIPFYTAYLDSQYTFRPILTLTTWFMKTEMRSRLKALENALRSISGKSLEHVLAMSQFDLDFNRQFVSAFGGFSWSALGVPLVRGGWSRLLDKMRFPNNFELDTRLHDSTMDEFNFSMVRDIRLALFRNPLSSLEALAYSNLHMQKFCGAQVLNDGTVVWKDTGNDSGQCSTIVDNSLVTRVRLCAAFVALFCEREGRIPYRSEFDDFVASLVLGDDLNFSVSDEIVSWFNVSSVALWLRNNLGVVVSTPTEDARPAVDVEFLSQKTSFVRGFPLPVLDGGKMLCSMRWSNEHAGDVVMTYQRALQFRMITYSDPTTFAIVDDFANWLFRQYDSIYSGGCDWEAAKHAHFTQGELASLWLPPDLKWLPPDTFKTSMSSAKKQSHPATKLKSSQERYDAAKAARGVPYETASIGEMGKRRRQGLPAPTVGDFLTSLIAEPNGDVHWEVARQQLSSVPNSIRALPLPSNKKVPSVVPAPTPVPRAPESFIVDPRFAKAAFHEQSGRGGSSMPRGLLKNVSKPAPAPVSSGGSMPLTPFVVKRRAANPRRGQSLVDSFQHAHKKGVLLGKLSALALRFPSVLRGVKPPATHNIPGLYSSAQQSMFRFPGSQFQDSVIAADDYYCVLIYPGMKNKYYVLGAVASGAFTFGALTPSADDPLITTLANIGESYYAGGNCLQILNESSLNTQQGVFVMGTLPAPSMGSVIPPTAGLVTWSALLGATTSMLCAWPDEPDMCCSLVPQQVNDHGMYSTLSTVQSPNSSALFVAWKTPHNSSGMATTLVAYANYNVGVRQDFQNVVSCDNVQPNADACSDALNALQAVPYCGRTADMSRMMMDAARGLGADVVQAVRSVYGNAFTVAPSPTTPLSSTSVEGVLRVIATQGDVVGRDLVRIREQHLLPPAVCDSLQVLSSHKFLLTPSGVVTKNVVTGDVFDPRALPPSVDLFGDCVLEHKVFEPSALVSPSLRVDSLVPTGDSFDRLRSRLDVEEARLRGLRLSSVQGSKDSSSQHSEVEVVDLE